MGSSVLVSPEDSHAAAPDILGRSSGRREKSVGVRIPVEAVESAIGLGSQLGGAPLEAGHRLTEALAECLVLRVEDLLDRDLGPILELERVVLRPALEAGGLGVLAELCGRRLGLVRVAVDAILVPDGEQEHEDGEEGDKDKGDASLLRHD